MVSLNVRLCCVAILALSSAACTSDGGDSMDASGTTGGETDSASGTASDDDPSASSSPSDTSASSSQWDTTTMDGTGDATSTSDDDGSTGDDGSSGTSDSADDTGGKDGCAGLDRVACNDDPDCRPITCRPYEMPNIGITPWCLGDLEFIGCMRADTGCADVRTTTCEGKDDPVYMCSDACIPLTWMECDPPVDGDVPMCEG